MGSNWRDIPYAAYGLHPMAPNPFRIYYDTQHGGDMRTPLLIGRGGGRPGGHRSGGGATPMPTPTRRRRFGNSGGFVYPYPYLYPYPYPYPWPDVADDDGDDTAVQGWQGTGSGSLPSLPSSNVPTDRNVQVELTLGDDLHLHARICVEGQCYDGVADLRQVIQQVLARVSATNAVQTLDSSSNAPTPAPSADPEAVTQAQAEIDQQVQAAGLILIGSLYDQHCRQSPRVSVGGFLGDLVGGIRDTFSALKEPIALAAGVAAGAGITAALPGVGAFLAPVAGKLAHDLVGAGVDQATGQPTPQGQAAQIAVDAAHAAAQTNPVAATVLSTAQQAVRSTANVYHVAQTVSDAVAGDPTARQALDQMHAAAADGNPAAQHDAAIAQTVHQVTGGDPVMPQPQPRARRRRHPRDGTGRGQNPWSSPVPSASPGGWSGPQGSGGGTPADDGMWGSLPDATAPANDGMWGSLPDATAPANDGMWGSLPDPSMASPGFGDSFDASVVDAVATAGEPDTDPAAALRAEAHPIVVHTFDRRPGAEFIVYHRVVGADYSGRSPAGPGEIQASPFTDRTAALARFQEITGDPGSYLYAAIYAPWRMPYPLTETLGRAALAEVHSGALWPLLLAAGVGAAGGAAWMNQANHATMQDMLLGGYARGEKIKYRGQPIYEPIRPAVPVVSSGAGVVDPRAYQRAGVVAARQALRDLPWARFVGYLASEADAPQDRPGVSAIDENLSVPLSDEAQARAWFASLSPADYLYAVVHRRLSPARRGDGSPLVQPLAELFGGALTGTDPRPFWLDPGEVAVRSGPLPPDGNDAPVQTSGLIPWFLAGIAGYAGWRWWRDHKRTVENLWHQAESMPPAAGAPEATATAPTPVPEQDAHALLEQASAALATPSDPASAAMAPPGVPM